jgi:hypothetical protein
MIPQRRCVAWGVDDGLTALTCTDPEKKQQIDMTNRIDHAFTAPVNGPAWTDT